MVEVGVWLAGGEVWLGAGVGDGEAAQAVSNHNEASHPKRAASGKREIF
jgi:hypothetical protein